MAKTIATVSGIAIAPGVSRNGRLYTKDAIAKAVTRAQERIAAGKRPIAMYTDHDTRKVTDIAGGLTRIWQDEDGAARYEAAIADTKAGRDVAALADPGPDGNQAILRGLSIKGNWVGHVRHVRVDSGPLLDTADDLEIARLDWTTEPGVDDAGVEGFTLTPAGAGEDAAAFGICEAAPDALLTITESLPEAHVTITEETAARTLPGTGTPGAGVLRVILGSPPALDEADTPALSKRGSGLAGAGRVWADPGYLSDKKQRYDISSASKAKAAWSFINQKDNASQYTGPQLKNIKARIVKALKRFGVTVTAEGWMVEPAFQVDEALAEYMGDPASCGSYSVTASNGPTNICVSGYGLDPCDLDKILRAAVDGACKALAALDPDMDGDIDVPGAGERSDPDGDAPGESADDPAPGAAEAAPDPSNDPASDPAAATDQGTEVPAVSETTTQEAAGAATAGTASVTMTRAELAALVSEAATSAVSEDRAARKAAKKARQAAAAGTGTPAETAGQPAAPVAEADEIAAAVQAKLTEMGLVETAEAKRERLINEAVTAKVQEMVSSGTLTPGRKGLVDEHTAKAAQGGGELPPCPPGKSWDAMHEWTSEDFDRYATPVIGHHVLGDRARLIA